MLHIVGRQSDLLLFSFSRSINTTGSLFGNVLFTFAGITSNVPFRLEPRAETEVQGVDK